jgi:Uma2 family endonuclease
MRIIFKVNAVNASINLAPITPTTEPRMTLEAYLNYDDGTDKNYELVDGVRVEMGAENDINIEIEALLISVLLQFLPFYLFRKGTEIEVPSLYAKTRYPDLMVLTEATRNAMKRDKRSIVLRDMPAPALVVEVVSPGDLESENYKRDYEYKPSEYASRSIPEYWIIDPDRAQIWVGVLIGQTYQFDHFTGNQRIVSPTFPGFTLTAEQVLDAGQVR